MNQNYMYLAIGIAAGVVITGLVLEGVNYYATQKTVNYGNVRGSGNESSSDAAAIGGGIRLSEKLGSLARNSGENADILESTS